MAATRVVMRPSIRLLITLLAAFAIRAAQLTVFAAQPASTDDAGWSGQPTGASANQPGNWEMPAADADADKTWRLLIERAGADASRGGQTVYWDPVQGAKYASDRDSISHVIRCQAASQPTTLTIDKTQIDNRGDDAQDDAQSETFNFSIVCTDHALAPRETTGTGTALLTGIPDNANCAAQEINTAGADTTTAGTTPAPRPRPQAPRSTSAPPAPSPSSPPPTHRRSSWRTRTSP